MTAKTGARNKPLIEYVHKRDFTRMPEPAPNPGGHAAGAFVVQKRRGDCDMTCGSNSTPC
jgi:hypothetical protein